MAYNIGDYVTVTGIVYENENKGYGFRIQAANGGKVRGVPEEALTPATPEQIKQYEAEAVEGMNPEAIIAREAAETADKAAGDDDSDGSDED